MTKKTINNKASRIHKTHIKFYKDREPLPIGLTLETKDIYLPYNKKTSQGLKNSRPVIIVAKQKRNQGKEEYVVIPGSTQKGRNTIKFDKYGIKYVKNTIEIEDNEGQPIVRNNKFRVSNNSTCLKKSEAEKLLYNNLNHGRFSSVNQQKMSKFENRYKKSQD